VVPAPQGVYSNVPPDAHETNPPPQHSNEFSGSQLDPVKGHELGLGGEGGGGEGGGGGGEGQPDQCG
jgi:hypothetical protein